MFPSHFHWWRLVDSKNTNIIYTFNKTSDIHSRNIWYISSIEEYKSNCFDMFLIIWINLQYLYKQNNSYGKLLCNIIQSNKHNINREQCHTYIDGIPIVYTSPTFCLSSELARCVFNNMNQLTICVPTKLVQLIPEI